MFYENKTVYDNIVNQMYTKKQYKINYASFYTTYLLYVYDEKYCILVLIVVSIYLFCESWYFRDILS